MAVIFVIPFKPCMQFVFSTAALSWIHPRLVHELKAFFLSGAL